MLPLKYSKFFRSGFLARERPSKPPPPAEESFAETSTSGRRRNSILSLGSKKSKNRESRPVSLILPSPSPATQSSSSSTIRDRRSSRSSFSSWWSDRKSTTSEDYLTFSKSPPTNRRELYDVPETIDVWITTGGPYTPKAIEKRSNQEDYFSQPIDPFAPSPSSKSIYIDLPDTCPPTPPTAKQESFLSLSTSSASRSIINLNLPLPRRERPTSIQTMPLPARSRPSSIYRKSKSDKSRWSIVTNADQPSTAAPESLQVDGDTDVDWPDLTHLTDWRQFHLDLLRDD